MTMTGTTTADDGTDGNPRIVDRGFDLTVVAGCSFIGMVFMESLGLTQAGGALIGFLFGVLWAGRANEWWT